MIDTKTIDTLFKDEEATLLKSTLREIKDNYNYRKHVTREFVEGVICTLRKMNKKLQAADDHTNEWVFCTDELPTKVGKYLITIANVDNERPYLRLANWNGRQWEQVNLNDGFIVVCWQKIPPAYNGSRVKFELDRRKLCLIEDKWLG